MYNILYITIKILLYHIRTQYNIYHFYLNLLDEIQLFTREYKILIQINMKNLKEYQKLKSIGLEYIYFYRYV